jgi:hypothetical protein
MSKDSSILLEDPAKLVYVPIEQLTEIDGAKFSASGVRYWSAARDMHPVVMPNGIVSGGTVTPGTANDTVSVSAAELWLNGITTNVSASAAEAVTRGTLNGFIVNAVTVNSAGAIVIIAGTEGTASSITIGAAGGPPYIPVDSVLVALVYFTDTSSALVLASEIKQATGQHMEMAAYPTWNIAYSGGAVEFTALLPLIHTGDAPKRVYASYASVEVPGSFTKLLYTNNFKIPEKTFTGTTTDFYNDLKIVDISSVLENSTFDITFKEDAGIKKMIDYANGDKRWLIMYPDEYKTAHFLCPPAVLSRTRDAITASASSVKATITMMSEEPAIENLQ